MQTQFPTLLIHPDPKLLDSLLELAYSIKCPKEHTNIRNYIVQNYLHFSKTKIDKKREKGIESQSSQNNRKKSQKSPEQLFLSEAIQGGLSWKEIAESIGCKPNFARRIEWNYSYYLIFGLLSRLPGTLGIFIGVRLMNRSWKITETIFQTLSKSTFIQQRISQLVSHDVNSLKKIQFAFLRDMILAIKSQQSIEDSLKRINFANWVDLKTNQQMDIAYYNEDWINFLCKQLKTNYKLQRPCIRYEKRQFFLKWTKVRLVSCPLKEYFQKKLNHLKISTPLLEEEFINEVEITLLEGVLQSKGWSEIKKKIEDFVIHINRIQDSSQVFFQNEVSQSASQRSLRSHKSDLSAKSGKSAKFSQEQKAVVIEEKVQHQKSMYEQRRQRSHLIYNKQSTELSVKSDLRVQQSSADLNQKRVAYKKMSFQERRSLISMETSRQTSVFIVRDQQVQVNLDAFQEKQVPRSSKQIQIDQDQELILSYCLKLTHIVDEIKRSSFQGLSQAELDHYCQQNFQNIEGKYIESIKFFERHLENLAKVKDKNLKTLIEMLIATTNSAMLRESIGAEWKKKKQNIIKSNEMMNSVKREMDKLQEETISRLMAMRTQRITNNIP